MPPSRISLALTWANDGLNYFVPAEGQSRGKFFHDDDGFTNDLTVVVRAEEGDNQFGLNARHRMITERGGLRREDEFLAEAFLERRASSIGGGETWLWAAVGVVATGPLGGERFQDGFHHLIHWGRFLDGGGGGQLQDVYEGTAKVGARLEAGLTKIQNLAGRWREITGFDVAASRGVGVSSGEVFAGLQRDWTLGRNFLELAGFLTLRHVHSEERRLTIPGGYPSDKTFLEPSAGITWSRGPSTVAFSLLLNVEGSRSHEGALTLGYRIGD
jgi:hypothetical protein